MTPSRTLRRIYYRACRPGPGCSRALAAATGSHTTPDRDDISLHDRNILIEQVVFPHTNRTRIRVVPSFPDRRLSPSGAVTEVEAIPPCRRSGKQWSGCACDPSRLVRRVEAIEGAKGIRSGPLDLSSLLPPHPLTKPPCSTFPCQIAG